MTLFDWLEEITNRKRDSNVFEESDWKQFNSYLIHKYISMNPDYIEVANIVQKIPHDHKKQIYNSYRDLLPKKKVWLKYIGSKKTKKKETNASFLAGYFECSIKEASEYADLIGEDGVQYYRQKQGINADIKPKKKKNGK